MRRKFRLCFAGVSLALLTTSATAQLIPRPSIKKPQAPQVARPQSDRNVTKPLLSIPILDNTLNTVRREVTPLIAQPLKPVSKLVTTIVGAPLRLTQPLLSAPLLAPNLAQTDASLNRVTSIPLVAAPPVPTFSAAPINAAIKTPGPVPRIGPPIIDRDPSGQLVLRGRILLIDPPGDMLARARAIGFSVADRRSDAELGMTVVTLSTPRGLNMIEAMRRLRSAAPAVVADFDHLYEPAGGALAPSKARPARSGASARTLIGMIDGGVARHPSLAGRVAEQRGFAGSARATGHGTAIASLLVGSDGAFRGSASNSALLVADVYGGNRSSGSASRVAHALSWLASRRPSVINISLVGPPNALLKRAIEAVRAKGVEVVAAVGNDGPAASPRYPASYPWVVAVTGVDSRGSVLLESGRAIDLDFAAPGADMAAARPGKGYTRVRGTSFAAALAAGRLATVGSPQKLAEEARPGKGRVGHGIVCSACRVQPKDVGAH